MLQPFAGRTTSTEASTSNPASNVGISAADPFLGHLMDLRIAPDPDREIFAHRRAVPFVIWGWAYQGAASIFQLWAASDLLALS